MEMEFFFSSDFWVKLVLAGIVYKLIEVLVTRGARAGQVGISRWFGRLTTKRRIEWMHRVKMFARFRETYELSRHANRTTQNTANFLFTLAVLLYVAAASSLGTHIGITWVFLVSSVLIMCGATGVERSSGRIFEALNSAGQIYVRREMRSKLLDPMKATLRAARAQ